ncbi:hypothetical protein [Natronorubrum sp. FCH18a]|uniref:hypothetical protein n=1 Tax=Natronorubrum sp. FCH18a TaxID=3447018 RepID=UPI003F51822B
MLTRQSDAAADGRPLSRRAALAATAALVSVTAGCAGFLDDDDDEVDGDLANDAPAETTLLVHLDVGAVTTADAERLLEDLGSADPEHLADAMATFEARTGLDPLEADELLFFGAPDADSGVTAADNWERNDAIVDGDWNEDDVVASLEETTELDYEETIAEDDSVLYEPSGDGADGSEAPFLGVLGDGRFVLGSGTAVRASLDVRYGDADPVSGPVRDAHDEARGGQLTVASESAGSPIPAAYEAFVDLDLDIFDEIEAVGRSYAVVDAGIALEVDLHVDDDRDAEELERVARGLISAYAGLDEEFDEARDDLDLERDGTVVTAAYEGEADVVFSLLDGV